MMGWRQANEWTPIGVSGVEPEADATIRSMANSVVIAGPGAGKTELLAQRACFLLQCGICRPPRRILAISFKRDAARNLRERVQMRCGKDAARTFDSLTFDAFAKSLLDRFRLALPTNFRLPQDYKINNFSLREVRDFLRALTPPLDICTKADIQGIAPETFLKNVLHRFPIGQESHEKPGDAWAAAEFWKHIFSANPIFLSFPVIGRLSELVMRNNPQILNALRETYQFVFLDEFQDTTRVQFDLTRTAFHGSNAVLTAVGDNKQRIMGWAEALEDAFDEFQKAFGGVRRRLLMNYRSAPRLVAIQRFLIEAIDEASPTPQAAPGKNPKDGECRILIFDDPKQEATFLADHLQSLLTEAGASPRDVCILVKQRAPLYSELIIAALAQRGIAARVESELQDVLAEQIVECIIPILRFVSGDRRSWNAASAGLAEILNGHSDEYAVRQAEQLLTTFARAHKFSGRPTAGTVGMLIDSVVSLAGGIPTVKQMLPQYSQGDYLERILQSLKDNLGKASDTVASLGEALDAFEGLHSIPIMTIHKSKGLEYRTVVFVGLEDSAFWSFRTQSAEDTCAFFVAFSRAKMEVLFTFCNLRVSRDGYAASTQTRNSIGALYELLTKAGVQPERISGKTNRALP